jgi:hypothetical protein
VEPLDRNASQIESQLRERPSQSTGAVEPGREFRALQPGIGDTPFAAH